MISYNGRVVTYNDRWIDPYNPLNLPPNTIRCKFRGGYLPVSVGDTQTLVDSNENIWDIYKQSNDWSNLLAWTNWYLLEILGANTSNVINMNSMCYYCDSLTTVALFDTSNVTDMGWMFHNCISLTSVPLFDTNNVTIMDNMFYYCYKLTSIPLFNTSKVNNTTRMFVDCYTVQSGALALYQQMSTQTNPPQFHASTFRNCGVATETGAAEYAQIPSNWK